MPQQNVPCIDAETPAEAPPKEMGSDRRVWVRHAACLASSCEPVAMPTASQPEQKWQAVVSDLSVGGVALTLRRRFERGTPLAVELPSASRGTSQLRTARVVQVRAIDQQTWLLGCQWDTALTEEELNAVV